MGVCLFARGNKNKAKTYIIGQHILAYLAHPCQCILMQRLSTHSRNSTDSNEQKRRDRLSDRFLETVWDDDRICNNCYRQVAEVRERNYHVMPDGEESVRTEPVRDMVEELAPEEYRRVTANDAPDSPLTRGMTGACDCGAIRKSTIDRPVDAKRVFVLTARAVGHYRDSGMVVNGEMAMARVAHNVRDPAKQHEQDSIIASACDRSIDGG